jgi:hypothetical protein
VLLNFATVNPLSEDGLLGNHSDSFPRVVLLGTSFSQRYRRDAYQVADALSAALGARVANFSVTGGGMIGAMEANLLNGRVNSQTFDLAVWELSFTHTFDSTSKLRQLLGALQGTRGPVVKRIVSDSGVIKVALHVDENREELRALAIDLGTLDLADIEVQLDRRDGGKTEFELERTRRIPDELRTPIWYISLKGFSLTDIAWIHVRVSNKSINETVLLSL